MNKLKFAKRACAVFIVCTATGIVLHAQTFTVLHDFASTDGTNLYAGLVQGTDGEFYGTTFSGGTNDRGTVFEITSGGALTTLYNFGSGAWPNGLIQAADGNFYGTTGAGGTSNWGTVFKMATNGSLTLLYSFCAKNGCADGSDPQSGLIQATDGNFYGTTFSGGAHGEGTVFKVTSSGALSTLYSFCALAACTDGSSPIADLVQASDGSFYGTTQYGGSYDYGTVFRITPCGKLTTLHSFDLTDGAEPAGALMQASDGSLYGTSWYGGANGWGTIFEITTSNVFTTVYNFCSQSGCADGQLPIAGLIQGSDGNFYGSTQVGGLYGYGVLFEFTPAGSPTVLHSFDDTDGAEPQGALVQGTDGNFYGTTESGGDNDACGVNGCGTVFSLAIGLAPFVETEPNHGIAGRVIEILGSNLAGASIVTFNGTAAVFKVVSNSLIGAVVPAGATSGTVQVTTPSGVLSSNVPFRVVP